MEQEQSSLPTKLPFWTREMLDKFCGASEQVNYKRGSTILHPLMTNQFVFLLESGLVNYRYFSKDGNAVTVQQMRPGELFGIKALFNCKSERRHFFVMADSNVKLWKMSKESFQRLLESDCDFARSIVQYFVYYVDRVEQKLMHSAVLDNYHHLVLMLMDCAEDIRNNTAIVQTTQQSLADLLMLSRQSVSAYLAEMTRQGLIEVRRGRICIMNWDGLVKELHSVE